ncbi:SprB repeat-containing protein, partial [Flavobacterium sp. 316]|uniref:SprB repeat-containing protein n=1 Tax=Flavobacterium sp. 316 TaxID=1603293 RepID=UPI0019111A1D
MKQKITLLLFIISFFCLEGNAQTQFWSDSFEDVGAPSSGTRTPSIAEFSCGGPPATAYFKRTDLSGIALQSGTYSNFEGSKFWAAEDIDRGPTCSSNSISANQQVTWSGINIAGKTGLSFKGFFACNNINGSFQGTDWINPGPPAQDFIVIEYRIDGGSWNKIIGIYADNASSSNTFSVDTNGDLLGDGTALTYAFTELSANIPNTGSTLDIRFNCHANASASQEIAVDNFRLFEAPSCTDPTVPTVTATANPVCNGASTTINITGTLNDATQWAIYTGSCGGSLLGTTASSTFAVTPSGSSTTYYIRGEGGCVTSGTCATITINVNPALTASISSQTNVACNGGTNGAATVTPTGGTGPFNYSWSPSGITTATATGLAAGTYNVMVTDANNCSASTSVTITEPTTLVLTPSSQTNVSCNGGSNGAATVNVATGGAGGYTYNWTPGNPTGDGTTSVTGLPAGTWTCTVTDANSCTTTQSFTITQPTALVASANSQTNVSCNGGTNGSATVSVTGGTPGYTYSWAPSGGTAATATGLTAGTYTVTVTDANSCTTTQSFTITEPSTLIASASVDNNASCNGETDGAATASASGGTA